MDLLRFLVEVSSFGIDQRQLKPYSTEPQSGRYFLTNSAGVKHSNS